MLEQEKEDFLRVKIRRDFLLGRIGGIARIPTSEQIEAELQNRLAASSNNIVGRYNRFVKKKVSSPKEYSDNIKTTQDNLQILMDRTAREVNEVIDLINDSTVEKNNASRELRKISTSFKEVETGQLVDNQLSYAITDALNDNTNIDLDRTTADVNLNAGEVILNQSKAKRLQFSHYLGHRSITPVITTGRNNVVETEQIPGTTWGAAFSPDDTDRWEYMAKTDAIAPMEAFITIKLTPDGLAVKINEVIARLTSNASSDKEDPNGFLKLEYRDLQTDSFRPIPGGAKEVTGEMLSFCFSIPETTHIRMIFHKNLPDDLETLQYFFGLTELVVRKSSTAFESVLQTKSMEAVAYRNELPTIYSAMLDTEQSNIEGTKIRHWVALDEPIPGKVLNDDGERTCIDAEDAFQFVPNGTNTAGENENFFVYATQLRDRPDVSGAFVYEKWEPKWQEISPLNDRSNKASNVVFFNNSHIRDDIHDISFLDPFRWGDPRYTGPWPTANAASEGIAWADDWDGVGTMPMSGFIWGEDPFSFAGIWWGDGIEHPGWWRPRVPDVSGEQTWNLDEPGETQQQSFADYAVPVYNDDCELQDVKQFWKVWKFPKDFSPIPGSVKLSTSIPRDINESEKTIGHIFKENRSESINVERDFKLSVDLKQGEYFVNVKLDELPEFTNRKDFAVIRDNISEIRIKDFGVLDEFFTEFGVDHAITYNGSKARDNDLDFDTITETVGSEPIVNKVREVSPSGDAHFTVLFPAGLDSYSTLTGNDTPTVELTFDFRYNTNIESTWETFTFVRDDVEEGEAFIQVNDPSGVIESVTVESLSDNGILVDTQVYTDVAQDITIPRGWAKVKILTEIDLSVIGEPSKWQPSEKFIIDGETVNAFEQSTVVRNFASAASMTEVDLYTLMHETDLEDDTRFASVTDADGAQFLVVKTPSTSLFPSGLVNGLRFTRSHFDASVSGNFLTFTTGTSGNIKGHPQAIDISGAVTVDGNIQNRPPNTVPTVAYDNISTFGQEIQIDDPCGSGFLFWDTAENLEMFYNIEYKLPARNRPSNRILYMTKLISNDAEKTPALSSFNLILNSKEDVRKIK